MLHPSNTRFSHVLPWFCVLSVLFLLIAGSWAAYTYAYLTNVPPGDIMLQQPLEYYQAQARMIGTLMFLPIVFLSAILVALWIFLRRQEKRSQTHEKLPQHTLQSERQRSASDSFPSVHMCSFRWFCVLISWIILLAGMFLAGYFAIKAIAPVIDFNPANISFGLALSIFILIFIPALFLFVVLNAIGTLAVSHQRRSATD